MFFLNFAKMAEKAILAQDFLKTYLYGNYKSVIFSFKKGVEQLDKLIFVICRIFLLVAMEMTDFFGGKNLKC